VILSHGNLLANAAQVRDAHRLTGADVALCVLPIFHINGFVITLLAPLLSGGRVVMPRRFSAEKFWGWVRDYRATWFSGVPTILSLLLSHEGPSASDLPSLRFARSASASLPVAVLERFEERFGVPVIEAYGISEAAGQVTSNPLPPLRRKPGSAGIAVGNRVAILDAGGRSLPAGTVGEVAVRGGNVFAGYLENPRADREALRHGWFLPGDLGYLDQDGYLFLTGRKKELINRAGEKISPREVEEIIHRLPEVESVGVVGVPHALYGEEVAAFVVLRPGSKGAVERIRTLCRENLASFKVPREVFFIDEFPKGPSGKIQRRRLLEVYNRIAKSQLEESAS
jgi:acyl-CoA synthetase (AMP-forming)/AMP-acid ligase II